MRKQKLYLTISGSIDKYDTFGVLYPSSSFSLFLYLFFLINTVSAPPLYVWKAGKHCISDQTKKIPIILTYLMRMNYTAVRERLETVWIFKTITSNIGMYKIDSENCHFMFHEFYCRVKAPLVNRSDNEFFKYKVFIVFHYMNVY